MEFIIKYIFIYGWFHILIFIPLFLLYLPVLSLRVIYRKKKNKKDIKFKQILFELIIMFILMETFFAFGPFEGIV